jgi:hypothetical protein
LVSEIGVDGLVFHGWSDSVVHRWTAS